MSVTGLCVRPIGSDLVALSALDTLVRKMGYADWLLSLSREELWILSFDLDDGEAGEVTEMLVKRTGIFVNPNTHIHTVVRAGELMPHGIQCGREGLGIAVWPQEDSQVRPVAVAVRERMGVESLKELRRLILWWPRFAQDGGEGRSRTNRGDHRGYMSAAQIAESMVATRSRQEGLLANPHYQRWCIIERGLKPHELLRTIVEIEVVCGT